MRRPGGHDPDEFDLLCERCGYSLEGLEPPAACPECSLPAARSLPGLRSGTPYQRRPDPRAVLPTVRLMLAEPGAGWVLARPVWYESWWLGIWLTAMTSLLLGLGGVGLLTDWRRVGTARGEHGVHLWLGLSASVPVFVALFVLCRLAESLLRARFGPPRGRLDRAGAVTVVAHAGAGLFAAAVVLAALGIASELLNLSGRHGGVVLLCGLGLGLLWSAGLTCWGARALRYANRSRAWLVDADEVS